MAFTKKKRIATESLVTLVAAASALIGINALSCTSRARVDLTEQKIYSLSPGSRTVVRGLSERLLIKAYFGNVPPEQADDMNYVDSLLAEYAASSERVSYEKIEVDTSAESTETQKKLADEGIQPIVVMTTKDDTAQQALVYFHVKLQYLDKNEVWKPSARFALENVEYDFSAMIRRIGYGKKKIGVTQGFGEPSSMELMQMEGRDVGGGIKIGLQDLYELEAINWNTEPKPLDHLDLVIVNGPTEKVSDKAQYHLDQFIMKGKPVVFLLHGMKCETQGGNEMQMQLNPEAEQPFMCTPVDHGLGELLATYGFEVGKDVLLDTQNGVPGVILLGQRPAFTNIFFPLVEVFQRGDHEILEGFRAMPMPFASSVKLMGPLAGKEGKFEGGAVFPLLRTAPTAFAKDDIMIVTRQTQLPKPSPDKTGRHLVGAAFQGKLKSHFADKPKPDGVDVKPEGAEGDKGEDVAQALAPTVAESPETTRLAVIGSSALAEDRAVSQQVRANPNFLNGLLVLHSLVDWATMDENLISLRAKQVMRPLEPVEKSTRLLIKYGNMAGVPLALILFGVVYWQVRERRRKNIKL